MEERNRKEEEEEEDKEGGGKKNQFGFEHSSNGHFQEQMLFEICPQQEKQSLLHH